jgi:hypothetical protein
MDRVSQSRRPTPRLWAVLALVRIRSTSRAPAGLLLPQLPFRYSPTFRQARSASLISPRSKLCQR